MRASRPVRLLLALGSIVTPTLGSVERAGPSEARIPVATVASPAEPVEAWDPSSPQRLVRIDGELYQEDAGFYYRVIGDRISVRLAEGVADWPSLVGRAASHAQGALAALELLAPQRSNRLGVVDLTLPHGDPVEWCELLFGTGLVRYAEVVSRGAYLDAPNDPDYPDQWALHNTGQTGGTPGADVNAELAWAIATGSSEVVVAVIDSGTDVDHPDLVAGTWHNAGEIPGNGTDDDGNGFVDDWEGWDFGSGNNDPRTGFFHGTHVTGIVNATRHNGLGIAGLAGGAGAGGVRAMAMAVGEFGPDASVIDDAILYAADNGASVITLSLSVGPSSAINDALIYARDVKDVFIDCAAGNNGSSVGYPASRPEVMAVASTTASDERSSFSNPGPELDIAAPGSNILSTQLGGSYGTSSGTSFAAPYVGALAALIRGRNPALSATEVAQVIIDSAEDVEAPGFDEETGFGRIDAFAALSITTVSDGTIRLDAGAYACSDVLTVTVNDTDLAALGTLPIGVASASEPAGEELALAEAGSGVFQGTLETSSGPALADGRLQVAHGETVVATYVDADDGNGGTHVAKTATASIDCAPPQISGLTATPVDDTTVTIAWTTDEEATGVVRYGQSTPPGGEASSTIPTTGHSVSLTDLEPCSVYRYEVEVTDVLGNSAVADNGGLYHVFETFGDFDGGGITPCHEGQAVLDRATYDCSDTVRVAVTDLDLGSDAQAIESIEVLMTSSTEPAGEWLALVEITTNSLRFEGAIAVGSVPAGPDGVLAVAPGDLVTVTYHDGDDGEGLARIDTYTAVIDCAPPQVRDVQVTAISSTRAEVSWTTDKPATSRVDFGDGPALGSVVADAALVTSHRLAVSPFEACTRVHFRVSSADASGDLTVADAAGEPYALNLRRIGGLVFHDNFETPGGFTLQGEWERGTPLGLGSASADPAAAYSGASVIGNDLGGEGAFAGDYEPQTREWARTPLLDLGDVAEPELILRRKLGVAGPDQATIVALASDDHVIWSSGGSNVDDTDWVEARYDLASQVGGESAVRIGFGMESNQPGQSFGWNLDEVIVKDANEPDYPTCGGCAGAPTFRGISSVDDPDPCAGSGLAVAWEAAPAWGTGGGGSYDVYRGTTADFVPGPAHRVATGVAGTTWTDANVPADTTLWYVVRARNDESCGGGEGLSETNLVRLPAVESTSQPLPGSLGSSLRAADVGDAHVRLTWDAAPGAASYHVLRAGSPDFTGAVQVGSVSGTIFEDVGAAADGEIHFYRVVPVNACGQE